MRFTEFLNEMFNDTDEYTIKKFNNKNSIYYDILTNEKKNYRLKFEKINDDFFIAEFGYSNGKYGIEEIMGEFFNVKKLISTLESIFISIYLSTQSINTIYYKLGNNKSYKLLINSIIKNELKNYYSVLHTDNNKDFGLKHGLLIYNNKISSYDAMYHYKQNYSINNN